MLRLTASLSVVLGFGVLSGIAAPAIAPQPATASPDGAEDPLADWNKRWDRAMADAAKAYKNLADRYQDKLEATSAYTRRFILRYQPDDEETRKFLGYVKEKLNDGTDNWKWAPYDVIRTSIRELSDLDDPKGTKYNKEFADANNKVAQAFKALAKKAAEYGAAKDASADAKWAEKVAMSWERVLEVDDSSTNKLAEEAHKELKHPKYAGKSVSPFKLQFLKARDERKKAGEKTHAMSPQQFKVQAVEPDGTMATAGLVGGGARSEHMVIHTTHGKEVAIRLATSCEQALADLIQIYGFPPETSERLGLNKIISIKDQDEFRKVLVKGAGWKDAEVQRYIDAHLGGTGTGQGGEFVRTSSAGADADDGCMAITSSSATRAAQQAARAELASSTQGDIEDWLWQSIGYDVTKRVNGTALTIWGAFGRYGDAIEPRPGEDKWVELARRQVMTDDDVPLWRLPKLKLENKDIKGPETIKGWAFLQFVFEKDPERAKKFVQHALANGTANAVMAVYPDSEDNPDPLKSMEKLDAEYREWIIKGW